MLTEIEFMSVSELIERWQIESTDFKQRFIPQAYHWKKGDPLLKIPSWPLGHSGTFYMRFEIKKIEEQNPLICKSPGTPEARKAIQKQFQYISSSNLTKMWNIHYSVLAQLNITAYLLPDILSDECKGVWGGFHPMVYYPHRADDFKQAFYLFSDVEKISPCLRPIDGSDFFLDNPIGEKQQKNRTDQDKEDLKELLETYCPKLEKFYAMWSLYLKDEGIKKGTATQKELRDTAVDTFLLKPDSFNPLKKFHIEDEESYRYTESHRKSIITSILQNIIKEELQTAWSNRNIKTNVDILMVRHNAIVS